MTSTSSTNFSHKDEITDDYLQEEMDLTEILSSEPPDAEAIRALMLERAATRRYSPCRRLLQAGAVQLQRRRQVLRR